MAATTEGIKSTPRPDVSVSIGVIENVSEFADVPVGDLPPLVDVIDPDALDALFAERATTASVTFRYADCEVTVHSDRRIELSSAE